MNLFDTWEPQSSYQTDSPCLHGGPMSSFILNAGRCWDNGNITKHSNLKCKWDLGNDIGLASKSYPLDSKLGRPIVRVFPLYLPSTERLCSAQ